MRERFRWRFGVSCDGPCTWGHFKYIGINHGMSHGMRISPTAPYEPFHRWRSRHPQAEAKRSSLPVSEYCRWTMTVSSSLCNMFNDDVQWVNYWMLMSWIQSHISLMLPLFVPLHKYKTIPRKDTRYHGICKAWRRAFTLTSERGGLKSWSSKSLQIRLLTWQHDGAVEPTGISRYFWSGEKRTQRTAKTATRIQLMTQNRHKILSIESKITI